MGTISDQSVSRPSEVNTLAITVKRSDTLYNTSPMSKYRDPYHDVDRASGQGREILTGQMMAVFDTQRETSLPEGVASVTGVGASALGIGIPLQEIHDILVRSGMQSDRAEEYASSCVDERIKFVGSSMQTLSNEKSSTFDNATTARIHGTAPYLNITKDRHRIGQAMEAYVVRPTEAKMWVQHTVYRHARSEMGMVGPNQIPIGVRPLSQRALGQFVRDHLRTYITEPGMFTALHHHNIVGTSITAGVYNIVKMFKTAFCMGLYTLCDTTGLTLAPIANIDYTGRSDTLQRPDRMSDATRDADGEEVLLRLSVGHHESNPGFRRFLYKDPNNKVPSEGDTVRFFASESYDIAAVVGSALGVFEPQSTPSSIPQRFAGHVWGSILSDVGSEGEEDTISGRSDSRENAAHVSLRKIARQFEYDMVMGMMGNLLQTPGAHAYEFGNIFAADDRTPFSYRNNIAKTKEQGISRPDETTDYGRLLMRTQVDGESGFLGVVNLMLARLKNYAGMTIKETDKFKMGAMYMSQRGAFL